MKVNNKLLVIKIPEQLRQHSTEYFEEKGGVSDAVRKFLIRSTKFKPAQK